MMLLLAAVAAVVVLAGGFFLGVRPQLDSAAASRADVESIDATNDVTRTELARLREQAKTLPEQRAALATLSASVPGSPNPATFISALNTTADQAGVKVSSITVGDAQAYTPPVTAEGTPADGGAAATPAPSATAAPTGTAPVPTAVAPTTDSSITAQNFSVIPVTVSVTGDFSQALAFVKGAQAGERLFLVNSISSSIEAAAATDAAAADAPTWSFSGSVYVLTSEVGATTTPTSEATPAG
jgi:Tfp pilus assembly protein PilO